MLSSAAIQTQSGSWKCIQGDLNKLLGDPNSREVVFFEREDAGTSATATLDNKTSAETKQLKPLQIVLCRTVKWTIDINKPNGPPLAAGTPVYLYILFGNGKKRIDDVVNDYPIANSNWLSSNSNAPLWNYNGFHSSALSTDANMRALRQLLGAKDRFATDHYLGFAVGYMRDSWVKQLFGILEKVWIITSGDRQFLETITPHREPSDREKVLEAQLSLALKEKHFSNAVEIAKQLHALSREEVRKRGSSYTGKIHDEERVFFTEDCDAAWWVAKALEHVSPLHAIAALEILAEYDRDGQRANGVVFFHSLVGTKAEKKIMQIRQSMNKINERIRRSAAAPSSNHNETVRHLIVDGVKHSVSASGKTATAIGVDKVASESLAVQQRSQATSPLLFTSNIADPNVTAPKRIKVNHKDSLTEDERQLISQAGLSNIETTRIFGLPSGWTKSWEAYANAIIDKLQPAEMPETLYSGWLKSPGTAEVGRGPFSIENGKLMCWTNVNRVVPTTRTQQHYNHSF